MSRVPRVAACAVAAAMGLASCAAPAPQPGRPAGTSTLTVFAAASLTGSFERLATSFEAANPGVDVRLSSAGSNTLVDQLRAGAPADVLAAADEATYRRAQDSGLVGPGTVVATNALTLVVAPGNPLGITGLDASLHGRLLVVCAVGVPCGTATDALARDTGATLRPASLEQSVTDVLGKVISGQADAGVVYATDARAAGDRVATVALPRAADHPNRYPVGVVAASGRPDLARRFVDHVVGAEGRAVLADLGFGAP